ncbi:MAG: haloacid dehalogenase-like hydrolase, partial [Legionella sp.]|nr:haloacid dehalogenase-like hydrolase [Legionella sp.]
LKIVAKKYNINHLICSEIEFDSHNISTGTIHNGYCLGDQKVLRLQNFLNERDKYIIYAYGDSSNDKPLIEFADYGFYRKFE